MKETPDASTIDADQSGTATVKTETMLQGAAIGAAAGTIDVVSMLPNNKLLETIKTDASGAGSIKVYPGGSVTAVYRRPGDTGAEMVSYLGVKPNDTLTFGSRNFSLIGFTDVDLGNQAYSWSMAAPGATNHCALTSCNSACAATSPTMAVAESASCNRTPMDVLYYATNVGGQVTHYSYRPNYTFTAGSTVLTTFWAPLVNVTVNISGVSAEITSVLGNWATVINNQDERFIAGSFNGTPTGGAFTNTFGFHNTGDRTIGRVSFRRAGSFSPIVLLDGFNPSNTTQTIASPQFTPWLQSGAPLASAALRTVSWNSVSSPGSVTDGTVLLVSWNHTVGSVTQIFRWHLIIPPGVSSITLPDLPAPLNNVLPAPEDFLSAQVRIFDLPVTGYDAVRALPSRSVMCIDCAVRAGEFQRAVFSGFVN